MVRLIKATIHSMAIRMSFLQVSSLERTLAGSEFFRANTTAGGIFDSKGHEERFRSGWFSHNFFHQASLQRLLFNVQQDAYPQRIHRLNHKPLLKAFPLQKAIYVYAPPPLIPPHPSFLLQGSSVRPLRSSDRLFRNHSLNAVIVLVRPVTKGGYGLEDSPLFYILQPGANLKRKTHNGLKAFFRSKAILL